MFCPHRSLVPVALAAVFLFTSPLLHAASWALANGDRLSGKLLGETETHIEIEHAALGRLTIARTALQPAAAEEKPAEEISLAVAEEVDIPPATESAAVAVEKPRLKWMTRRIEVGYTRQDGARDKEDITARVQAEARLGSNTFRATAQVIRSASNDEIVTDRQEANFRWRHDFDKRRFAQALTTYSSDDVRNINLSVEQQIGGGYRLYDAPRQQINVGLGAVVQWLDRDGNPQNTALLGSAFQDYSLRFNDRVRLTQEATVLFADGDSLSGTPSVGTAPSDGNYRVKFNAALQTKMTPKASLNLRYEYDYDTSVTDTSLRADSRLTTSLGYSW